MNDQFALRRRTPVAIWLGALLLLASTLLTNAWIESGLAGRLRGSLEWGPTFFRSMLALNGLALMAFGWVKKEASYSRPLTSDNVDSREWLIVGALCALGLALRVWELNTCLWLDEVLTLVDFARLPLGQIVSSFPNQNQHLLYSILAHSALSLFGEQPWALRLPAVIFGVLSIPALFLLARKVIGSVPALLTCALMTLSYHHVWFSQNARGYTGLLLFSCLATFLCLEAVERPGWFWWAMYAAALCLGCAVHMTMAFVLLGHFFALLILGRWLGLAAGIRRKAVVAWVFCCLWTLALYALALPEFFRSALHEKGLATEWKTLSWFFAEIAGRWQLSFFATAVLVAGGFFVLAGWLGLFRKNPLATAVISLPVALGAIIIVALGLNLWPRFFFFSMGFALLIVVWGAISLPPALCNVTSRLRAFMPLAHQAGITIVVLLIVASASTLPRCYALPKQDFCGARAYVEKNRVAGEDVITVGLAALVYGRYLAPAWTVAAKPGELPVQPAKGAWLVYTIPVQLKAWHPDLWKLIQSHYEVVKVFPGTLGDGAVYVCRHKRTYK